MVGVVFMTLLGLLQIVAGASELGAAIELLDRQVVPATRQGTNPPTASCVGGAGGLVTSISTPVQHLCSAAVQKAPLIDLFAAVCACAPRAESRAILSATRKSYEKKIDGLFAILFEAPEVRAAYDAQSEKSGPFTDYVELLMMRYSSDDLKAQSRVQPGDEVDEKKLVVPDAAYDAVRKSVDVLLEPLYGGKAFDRATAIFNKAHARARVFARAEMQKFVEAACPAKRFDDKQSRAACIEPYNKKLESFDALSLRKANHISVAVSFNSSYATPGWPHENTIGFGLPYLELLKTNPEAFELMLEHEIGHKIYEILDLKNNEAHSVVACLRGSKSIAAAVGSKEHKIPDQANEAFADWFAAEMMTQRLGSGAQAGRKYIASLRSWCGPFSESDPQPGVPDDAHPFSVARMNRLFAAHPVIRKAFGKGPVAEPKYCALDGTP